MGLRYICPSEGGIHNQQSPQLQLSSHTLSWLQCSLRKEREGSVVSVWITRSHHSILYLPPKEVSLPGFVQVAAGSGSHRVRDRISAEKDTKESVTLKGQKNRVRMEA